MSDLAFRGRWRVVWKDFTGLRLFADRKPPKLQFVDFSTKDAARAHADALKAQYAASGNFVVSVIPAPEPKQKRPRHG